MHGLLHLFNLDSARFSTFLSIPTFGLKPELHQHESLISINDAFTASSLKLHIIAVLENEKKKKMQVIMFCVKAVSDSIACMRVLATIYHTV